jgi:class 3 adenylate cyclase
MYDRCSLKRNCRHDPSVGYEMDRLKKFLDHYCPNSSLIWDAISRLGLWDIREFGPDEIVCSKGESADACWLILSGQAEIVANGKSIAFREAGELLGEQALLTTLLGKKWGLRSADIVARGPLQLLRFDAALQEKFNHEERAAWSLTLAAVINEKLEEATRQRAALRRSILERETLLTRFAEGDALAIVRKALEDTSAPVVSREVIVWFSDIANFSTWASSKSPEEVAGLARELIGRQINAIRAVGGFIDKLMGDGVMAVWFIDTGERRTKFPTVAVECAMGVSLEINRFLQSEGLGSELAIRIGLHAGRASFGDFGSQQRIAVTVLSHDVNMASRYEQAKADGLHPVRVSRQLKDLIESSTSPRKWAFAQPVTVQVKHGVEIEIYAPQGSN